MNVYRRKREGKTNYKKRKALVASGKPRLTVRVTNTRIITQVISFTPKGDKVVVATDSSILTKKGWKGSVKNIPAAYLTGYIIGKKAQEAKVKEAVFDIGFHTTIAGARIYALLKGAKDAGLTVPCSEEVFPPQERIEGKHMQSFENSIEKMKEAVQ